MGRTCSSGATPPKTGLSPGPNPSHRLPWASGDGPGLECSPSSYLVAARVAGPAASPSPAGWSLRISCGRRPGSPVSTRSLLAPPCVLSRPPCPCSPHPCVHPGSPGPCPAGPLSRTPHSAATISTGGHRHLSSACPNLRSRTFPQPARLQTLCL